MIRIISTSTARLVGGDCRLCGLVIAGDAEYVNGTERPLAVPLRDHYSASGSPMTNETRQNHTVLRLTDRIAFGSGPVKTSIIVVQGK